jgi:hypothetical protein
MARPKFAVQHFVFSEAVDYRNRARPHRNTILDGVDYVFGAPVGTEVPFDPLEFWLFARFYSTSDLIGDTRSLSIICYWLDSPTGDEEVEVWTRDIGPITFRRPYAVVDRTWVFRNPEEGEKTYRFPGPGTYAFKLGHATNKYPNWRVKAREYISVEVQP